MAEDYEFEVKEGDIILSATDGVLDNLFQHEMITIVQEFMIQQGSPLNTDYQAQELSKRLVESSREKFVPNNKQNLKTPYQRKYKKEYNQTWSEVGKLDDITAVITLVVPR